MELETIIYYYPSEELNGQECAVKKHWWQTVRLETYFLKGTFCLALCPVPKFYYKKKEWKAEVLSEAMEAVLDRMEGMTDVILHPKIERQLPEELRQRYKPRTKTLEWLIGQQLKDKMKGNQKPPDSAVVWLGSAQETDWQMEMTWELLLPYLPYINRCVIYYEALAGVDVREELGGFLDDYYYGYGLVVQMREYGERQSRASLNDRQSEKAVLRLDYRRDNLFQTVLKYLDTMVKNRYDN